jgi:hypothetical protein
MYPYPYNSLPNRGDSILALGKIDYRIKSLTTQCGYQYSQFDWEWAKITKHVLYMQAAYLSGSSITNVSQVNGNWDGYFSPMLDYNKILTQVQLAYTFNNENESSKLFTIQNTLSYGLFQYCTISENLGITSGTSMKPTFDLLLNTIIMNIPIRESGPSQVSNYEYVHGYIPKKGQLRLESSYRIPIQKPIISFYELPSLLEFASAGTVLGFAYRDNYTSTDPNSAFDWSRTNAVGSTLKNSDFLLKFSTGLSDYLVLLNSFALRRDRYRQLYDYSYSSYKPDSVFSNTIFAENLGLSFVQPGLKSFTIQITYLGQTDKHVSGREKNDWLLSSMYQSAF